MTAKTLSILIILTAVCFILIFATLQLVLLVALAVAVGILWSILETRGAHLFDNVFFLTFVVLAIVASLEQASAPIVVLALTLNLATWDLARFRRRTANGEIKDVLLLETIHLRKLAITLCAGFVIALAPLIVRLSVNFVIVLMLIFLTFIALRRSILYLQAENDGRN